MNRIYMLLFLFFLYPYVVNAQSEVPRGEMVWADEFEGTGIPDPTKWDRPEYNRKNNSSGPDGWWSRDDSYLDGNGNLVIRARKIDNKNNDSDPYDYSTGAIRTRGKYEKLYGVFEIRCQLPTQQGWWVAFWMMQGNVGSEANAGVDGSEVDIMEGFGWTDMINQAIHWDGYGQAHKSTGKQTTVKGIRNGFHIYTLEWYPDKYVFYIDGKETWRTEGGGVCNRPGYLKVTAELSTESWAINEYWSKDPAGAQYPDSFIVDYVRVYELPKQELPPIRDMVQNCYPEENLVVGAACHGHNLGTQTEEILDREFSYVTPANDFKQSYIHPEPGVWRWEMSDKWLAHSRENNQVLRLHAPISPQVSPWTKDDSRTAEELEQNLVEFMSELCMRYNDSSQVKWLDVVNETVYHTDGSWFGPKTGTDSWENPWPKMGYDESHELRPPLYIKKAFEVANQYAPNLKLIINQHSMEEAVWDKIKALVGYLRDNNLRVDGLGWQAHLWMGWEKVPGNMERLSGLIDWCHANNLEFHITEFNVWLKPEDLGKLTEQAETFYAVTKLAAEKQQSGFVGINFWHIRGQETQNKDRDGGPWDINYQPKEAYFKIKEALCEASLSCQGDCAAERLQMDIDRFESGSSLNLLKGQWESFSDHNSQVSLELSDPNGYSNTSCARIDWSLKKGSVNYPYAFVQTWLDSAKNALDLSPYHAIQFRARGKGLVNVGLVTIGSQENNASFTKTISLNDEWTRYQIAFAGLKQNGLPGEPDINSALALVFSAAGNFNEQGEMWLDNISFISENAMATIDPLIPPTVDVPKINQVGYLPSAFKELSLTMGSVQPNPLFVLLNKDGEAVYSGSLDSSPVNDSEISGELVYRGNFSDFKAPGNYQVEINGKRSLPFYIGEQVYDSLLWHTLRSFYLFEANTEKQDAVTGLTHPAGHEADFEIATGEGTLDLSGGWYDAGNYGKYVPSTAFSCANLLNLYELFPNHLGDLNLLVPGSSNDVPDILDVAGTGLDWLMKMQLGNGAVCHGLDSWPDVAFGYGPDEDPFQRELKGVGSPSTADAASFTAVMAYASQIYESVDSVFARQCREAALKSWEWVQANPQQAIREGAYSDPVLWQEIMWAKAEIFLLTQNQSVLGSLYSDLVSSVFSGFSWNQPQMLSFARLYKPKEIPSVIKSRIKAGIENYANGLKTITAASGYRSALGKLEWEPGTNVDMANRGVVFSYMHRMTGNEEWLNLAAQQLDYLLGRNSLNRSFVTGYGENSSRHPHHWISQTYGIVPSGLLVNGATGNRIQNLPGISANLVEMAETGFPSAKIYSDTIYSGHANETGIYAASSLAFLTGYLALSGREDSSTDAIPGYNKSNDLEVTLQNNIIYCTNCSGKTTIDIYNLTGQKIRQAEVICTNGENMLLNCDSFAGAAVILYRVTDKSGRKSRGKIKLRQ